MAGSSFGKILTVTTFGESHGAAIGAVLDGFPAGMPLSEEDIQPYLDRRKPGQSAITSQRKEADRVEILSGVFEGRTCGTPISLLIRNTDQHSKDYSNLKDTYRPGHADYGFDQKFGFRDYRGGGRSSGRETAARVAAGAIAEKFLKEELGIDFCFYTSAIGDVTIDRSRFDKSLILSTPTAMPDAAANEAAIRRITACRQAQDSIGGVVEGVITGVPAGIGDPVFDKLDARFGQALFSIGAVKEVGIGDGAAAAMSCGSQNNDPFCSLFGQAPVQEQGKEKNADEKRQTSTLSTSGQTKEQGLQPNFPEDNGEKKVRIAKKSNHAGGILGGMSDGSPILLRAYFKPTPSISRTQETVRNDGTPMLLEIQGRHDPVIVPRAVVVCETMCALTLLDAMLLNMSARAENVVRFYHPIPQTLKAPEM